LPVRSTKKAPKHIKSGPVPTLREWRSLPSKALTRGERNCRFIEKFCLVPEGDMVGQAVHLADHQVEYFLAIYDNPDETHIAIKSVARKNAKTAEAAFMVLIHTVGPEAVQNSRVISGAMSKEQAAEVYNYASKCVTLSPKLAPLCRLIPSPKKIIGLPMGVEYQAISADAQTAHGKSPILAVLDEVGQIRGPRSDFVDAITTAQGAYKNAMLVYISTQAPTPRDFFSIIIDDAIKYQTPGTVCHVYQADENCDLMDEEAWHDANPALGIYRSYADVRAQAEKAVRMPSFESTFRNLILNQRVESAAPFVSRKVWEENGQQPGVMLKKKVFGGLDLSSVADLTALVLVDEEGDVDCKFWLPGDGLLDKAKQDKVPYDLWADQGFLLTTPGRAIEYEYIAMQLLALFELYEVQQINFDRHNMKFLHPWLVKAGMTQEQIDKFKDFGQGFFSMTPALRDLETKLLQTKLKHGMHPILTMCAGNAAIETDAAGSRKFTKAKSTGRIDGMVALAMAVAAMTAAQTPDKEYKIYFL
jgi:phage terminase large subunit-like protein